MQAEVFLKGLPTKLHGKTLYVIDLLGQFGSYLAMPHSRKLKGRRTSVREIERAERIRDEFLAGRQS